MLRATRRVFARSWRAAWCSLALPFTCCLIQSNPVPPAIAALNAAASSKWMISDFGLRFHRGDGNRLDELNPYLLRLQLRQPFDRIERSCLLLPLGLHKIRALVFRDACRLRHPICPIAPGI